MPTLPELQAEFLRAVLDGDRKRARAWVADNGIAAEARLEVYANNSFANFLTSLRLSFPAVRRLVGDAYFDQCAGSYRERHPSRSGDLAGAGAAFADYLGERHRDDRYRYLSEVAHFEWLYQQGLAAADHAPLELARLAAVAPQFYDRLRFELHPAARLLRTEFPVLEIWEANLDASREPDVIDLGKGGEHLLLTRTHRQLFVQRIGGCDYAFLDALARREPLAAAVAAAEEAAAGGPAGDEPAFDAGAALQRFVLSEAIVDFDLQ